MSFLFIGIMSWIEKIQKKSQAEKMKIIWTVAVTVALLMIAVWIISARLNKNTPTDTTLFKTFGRGFKDVKNNFNK